MTAYARLLPSGFYVHLTGRLPLDNLKTNLHRKCSVYGFDFQTKYYFYLVQIKIIYDIPNFF